MNKKSDYVSIPSGKQFYMFLIDSAIVQCTGADDMAFEAMLDDNRTFKTGFWTGEAHGKYLMLSQAACLHAQNNNIFKDGTG